MELKELQELLLKETEFRHYERHSQEERLLDLQSAHPTSDWCIGKWVYCLLWLRVKAAPLGEPHTRYARDPALHRIAIRPVQQLE